MIVLFDVLILLLCLVGMQIRKDGFFQDYIGKSQCNAVKGACIIFVFASHILGYMVSDGYSLVGCGNMAHLVVNKVIGQLCVVMFLFYSGFGVAESIKAKGKEYIKSMPRRRVLTTLLNFAVAVVVFVLANLLMGVKMSRSQVVLSVIGWDSVGNSNWYIFVILLCYLIAWASGRTGVGYAVLIGCAVAIVSLSFAKPPHWYNTIFAFPAGMMYARHRIRIEEFNRRHYVIALCSLLALFAALRGFLILWGIDPLGIIHNILGVVFAGIVLLVTMKVKFTNALLIWFGVNLFPIYIYQRLPMLVFAKSAAPGFIARHSLLYMVSCFVLTLVIAYLYRYWRISDAVLGKWALTLSGENKRFEP